MRWSPHEMSEEDLRQRMAQLQSRVSTLTREKRLIFDQYVDSISEKNRLRELINRWQALATHMYNNNQAVLSSLDTYKERAHHWRALCRTNAALSDVREQTLSSYKKRLEEVNLCSLCCTNAMDCLLIPCYHGTFCSACVATLLAEQNPQCPMCRTPIRQHQKYFI